MLPSAVVVEKVSLLVAIISIAQCVGGDNCPSDKFTITGDHSACLSKSSLADESNRGVTTKDSKVIVDLHNKLRASVKDAANMQLMVWDDELAYIAQKWADNCDFSHDPGERRFIPGRFKVGQNLGFGHSSWTQAVQDWFAERTRFTFGDQTKNTFTDVGHYTQVVWANSTKIGCGFTHCSSKANFYVCNYGPSGNAGDWSTPYKQGSQCSDCKTPTDRCISSGDNAGLCDCGGRSCYNGGTMNLQTCQCQCKLPLYISKLDCALNCTDTKDPSYCGNSCQDGWQLLCPHQCDICPYGAFDYKEGSSAVRLATSEYLLLSACAVMWSQLFA